MKLAVDLLEPRLIDMGVDLRGGETGMAEHLLNCAQVGAMAEQVGRKRVAQKMGPNPFLQARQLRHFLDDLPDPGGGEFAAMFAEENFASGLGLDQ